MPISRALHTKAVMDGDTLVGVEAYLRLSPQEARRAGRVEIDATLDITGDGSLTAPLDGPEVEMQPLM